MTKAIYKNLAKTWPKNKQTKKTRQTVTSHQSPQPFFCKLQVSRQDLGSTPFPRPPSAHAAAQAEKIGCWPQWVSPVNAAWAKLVRRCFQALALVGRRIMKNSPLTEFEFLALRFFEPLRAMAMINGRPKLLYEKKCTACCHNMKPMLLRTTVFARLFKRGIVDSPT